MSGTTEALAVIREAVDALRHKHTKKACAKQGSFVCLKEKDAKRLADNLESAEIYLDGMLADAQ